MEAEIAGHETTANLNGAVRRSLESLRGGVLEACAGSDQVPFSDDDVVPEELFAGRIRFHPWGPEVQTALAPNYTAVDCIAMEPSEIWLRRAPLSRFIAGLACIAVRQALDLVQVSQLLPVEATHAVVVPIVPPPITYDAGADLLPLNAPDGVNDTAPVPTSTACSRPGLGFCSENLSKGCSLPPGAGHLVDPAQCPGPNSTCTEAMTGPDGVTAADVPAGRLRGGKFVVGFSSPDPTARGETISYIRCLVDGIRSRDGQFITTDPRGSCAGGPNSGMSCHTSLECDSESPPRFLCANGDEYVCTVEGIRFSNPDNVPPCGSECVAVLVGGGTNALCGVPADGLCFVSTCDGGDRDGQICTAQFPLDPDAFFFGCPGGTCRNLYTTLRLTGDEAGYAFPRLGSSIRTLCPVELRWDTPFEVVGGAGWAARNITEKPLEVCIPQGDEVHFTGAWVHEPGGTGATPPAHIPWHADNHNQGFGFYVRPFTSASLDGTACPSAGIALTGVISGLPIAAGVGPVIGVVGLAH